MSSKLRVGMIGAGRMANLHLTVLSEIEDVEMVAIANTPEGEERRKDACQKFHIPVGYDDFREMIKNEKLDAVFIAPRILDMFEISKACLSAGLDSFIEKPPGLSAPETEELLNIAESKNCIHMVGLQRRFYSHILKGMEIINEHGQLISIIVEAPERFTQIKAKPKFPESVLAKWIFANGIHSLDMLPFLGGEISDVTALNRNWDETVHPDSLHALIDFKSGAVGHYISNWSSPGGWSVVLYGQGCRIDIKPMEQGKVFYADGTEEDLPIDQSDVDFKPGIYAQNKLFIDACLGKRKIGFPAATLREACTSMHLAEAILDPSLKWSEIIQKLVLT